MVKCMVLKYNNTIIFIKSIMKLIKFVIQPQFSCLIDWESSCISNITEKGSNIN